MNECDAIKNRSTSWVWRSHVNHNRWGLTTDFLGFVGPCVTINRGRTAAGESVWQARIADRDGYLIVEYTTVALRSEKVAKKRAFSLLLQHIGE